MGKKAAAAAAAAAAVEEEEVAVAAPVAEPSRKMSGKEHKRDRAAPDGEAKHSHKGKHVAAAAAAAEAESEEEAAAAAKPSKPSKPAKAAPSAAAPSAAATVAASGSKRSRPAADAAAPAPAAAAAAAAGGDDFTAHAEGLPYDSTEADIEKFFAGCGTITSIIAPRYQDSGRLRGYAMVHFDSAAALEAALKCDGSYIGGRFINVSVARPKTAPVGARSRPAGCTTLFVKGLPYEAGEEAVTAAFAPFGAIASVRLARWNHTGRLKGFGYVQYAAGGDAEAAMAAYHDGSKRRGGSKPFTVGGRPVSMDWDDGAPRASFKTADGKGYYRTDEGRALKPALRPHHGAHGGAGRDDDGDDDGGHRHHRHADKRARRDE